MKLKGELPAIRLTAIILIGARDSRVRILGPRGGGNRPSSALRTKRKFVAKARSTARRASPRIPKAA